MAVLIDTNFLLAAFYARDKNSVRANQAIRTLEMSRCIVAAPVLHELFHLASVRINYSRAVDMLERMQVAGFDIRPLESDDRTRILEIMRQYASAAFDYTGAAMMALSERLNITQVYTFDQRDFRIFRPQHCPFLELLPAE
jgi:predicted nucleic acid-binding protein